MPINVSVKTRSLPSGSWSIPIDYSWSQFVNSSCESAVTQNSEYNFVWSITGSDIDADDYVIYKKGQTDILRIDITNPTGSYTHSFSVGEALCWDIKIDDTAPCGESNPCPEGEKCVDGECVPCDEQQATHFQIRAEFEELATIPANATKSMYVLSDVYPIGSGIDRQVFALQEVGANGYYFPRIRFCNSAGVVKPYKGDVAIYGWCNPDGSVPLYPYSAHLDNASHFIGVRSPLDMYSNNPYMVPRLMIEWLSPSDVIYETDCSSVTPEEPPDIEPVEPDQPDEPDEPTEPDEPDEPTEPLPPQPPPQPQEGLCPCEEYIGLQIKRAADILYDGLILLKRELSVIGRELVVELYEARKQQYQLSMFLQNQQFEILKSQHQRLFDIRQILDLIRDDIKKGLIEGDDGLVDIVKTGLQEGDKGLVDFVKDFTEQYEPVTIENEYRTQSHRVIDNLDEVVNKF